MNFSHIHPEKYAYSLPEDRIAHFPLEDRSASKLLVYHDGKISHGHFKSLPDNLPQDSLIIFNDTRVIPARIVFHKDTGARIEVFLLEPLAPSAVMEEAMTAHNQCTWKCMLGNAKRWKTGTHLQLQLGEGRLLTALRIGEQEVTFHWKEDRPFSSIVELAGKVPLPPYLHREPDANDTTRYQTVYSRTDGAVAAPTAGLHFTDDILRRLEKDHHQVDYLTLHVSAGTFQPIKSTPDEHAMHREQVVVKKSTIAKLLANDRVIAVGTTSMRTLESLYWYGVRILRGQADFYIEKLTPYEAPQGDLPTSKEALNAILEWMESNKRTYLVGYTEIFIFPGYEFRICKGLITNFHLPGTTLMMLVAAFVGDDWKQIYQEALANDYRFLSYGDSSFLLP